MGVLLVTGAFLFFPDLGGLIGNRQIVQSHRTRSRAGSCRSPCSSRCCLAPSASTRAGSTASGRPTGSGCAAATGARAGSPSGKFNAGQKLNSSFTLGAIIVMFGTGMVMFFSSLFSDTIRTGATFVHDWLALALAVVVLGHIYMAYSDPVARRGMRTGAVPEDWAQREHSAWAAELADASSLVAAPATAEPATSDDPSGSGY